MGFFSSLKERLPILSNLGGGKKSNKSSVELQYDKAMNLLENANGVGAVEVLDGITDIGMNDETYRQFGLDALNVLGELFENGRYSNARIEKDLNRAAGYYEKYAKLTNESEMILKVAKTYLDAQNFSKAITYFEKAADAGVKSAYMNLGSIYENGLSRIDEYGNKSEFVIPVDYDKAKYWYRKLSDLGDENAMKAYDRVDYAASHTDSLEFE